MKVATLENELSKSHLHFHFSRIEKDEELVFMYTGLPNNRFFLYLITLKGLNLFLWVDSQFTYGKSTFHNASNVEVELQLSRLSCEAFFISYKYSKYILHLYTCVR